MKCLNYFFVLLLTYHFLLLGQGFDDNLDWKERMIALAVEDDMEESTVTEDLEGQADDNSVFKFAWDMPANSERYPHLKDMLWLEPNFGGEMFVSLQHRREDDNQDNYYVTTYSAFRPFVLDFDSFSFAFGVSYIFRYTDVSDVTKQQSRTVGGLSTTATAEDITAEAVQQAVNFSMLMSFPEISLQLLLDIGYGWSHLRENIDPITLDVRKGNIKIAQGILDEYQYKQHDDAMYFGLNIFKSFESEYLNFWHIFFYTGYRLKTTLRNSNAILSSNVLGKQTNSGKHELPFFDGRFSFPDPATSDEYNLSFVGFNFETRLFTIKEITVANRGIGLNLFGSVQHFSGQLLAEDFHGTRSKLGAVVSLFDAVTIRGAYVWEQGNDQNDGYEVTVAVRVLGILREIASL